MAARDRDRKIVVVRKSQSRDHPRHGGSWKVAYADFVTALMAFFLVMWIVSMDSNAKDLIEGYFNNPVGFKKAYGAGTNLLATGTAPVESDLRRIQIVSRNVQRQRFEEVREDIMQRLAELAAMIDLEAQIEIFVDDDGLRIELIEAHDGAVFFELGSDRPEPIALHIFGVIARALGRLDNDVMIEGHTDAKRYGGRGYSNWELSVARANAVRRAMEENGLAPHRVVEVRGYADRKLRVPDDPFHPANRRVSILLPFREVNPALIRAVVERQAPVETD